MGVPEGDRDVSGVEWENNVLPPDVVFEILADRDRRTAVSCLLSHESTIAIDELIDEVLTATDTDADDWDDRRTRLRVAFYHTHLPKLSDAGVIEYRHVPEVVESLPALNVLEPVLKLAARHETAKRR